MSLKGFFVVSFLLVGCSNEPSKASSKGMAAANSDEEYTSDSTGSNTTGTVAIKPKKLTTVAPEKAEWSPNASNIPTPEPMATVVSYRNQEEETGTEIEASTSTQSSTSTDTNSNTTTDSGTNTVTAIATASPTPTASPSPTATPKPVYDVTIDWPSCAVAMAPALNPVGSSTSEVTCPSGKAVVAIGKPVGFSYSLFGNSYCCHLKANGETLSANYSTVLNYASGGTQANQQTCPAGQVVIGHKLISNMLQVAYEVKCGSLSSPSNFRFSAGSAVRRNLADTADFTADGLNSGQFLYCQSAGSQQRNIANGLTIGPVNVTNSSYLECTSFRAEER